MVYGVNYGRESRLETRLIFHLLIIFCNQLSEILLKNLLKASLMDILYDQTS